MDDIPENGGGAGRAWRGPLIAAAAIAAGLAFWPAAHARPARCTTTDDGSYKCDFKATDKDGSFELSAPGKPWYSLVMDEPGKAFGYVNLGGRNVSLPGRYVRSAADPACWVNDATSAKICAR